MKEEKGNVYKVIERKVKPEFKEKYFDIMRELRLSTDLGDIIDSVQVMERKTTVAEEKYEYAENISTIDRAYEATEKNAESKAFRERFRKIIPEQNIKSRFFTSNGKIFKIVERQIDPERMEEYEDIMRQLRISSGLGDIISKVDVVYHEESTFIEVYKFSSKYDAISSASKEIELRGESPAFRKRFREVIDERDISSRFFIDVELPG